jgi:uncharacterized membrane protein
MLRRLLRKIDKETLPRAVEVVGLGCLVLAIGIAFGVAPALAATGIALIVIAFALA